MSDGFIIIDRRKNPNQKSLSNRQRFLDRVKKQVREAARKNLGSKSIKDQGEDNVTIPTDGIEEPQFAHESSSGEYDHVLPGNKDFVPGDQIDKPEKKGGGGKGREGSTEGDGQDEFSFSVSYDEFLNIVFDGLELPNLVKESEKSLTEMQTRRAGFTTAGMPSNLNVERTMIAGLARRLALKAPKLREIDDLLALLEEEEDEDKRKEIEEEISRLRIRAEAVRFLDNVDLRYNNFTQVPNPVTQAVMFCVMDVSYSMQEREKIIAKKFFILLYLFLQRRYKKIDVIFVRHHSEASECDEETFFTDRTSGGTVISTAYELVAQIMRDRYPPDSWNVYLAQASDGDNAGTDNATCQDLLSKMILPFLQYMVYIEIPQNMNSYYGASSTFWDVVEPLKTLHKNISCKKIMDEADVVAAFRELFSKQQD